MSDYQLRARIPDELETKIKNIGKTIETENPGAEANISTICRYALEDYVKRYNGKKNKDTLFLEIPIGELNENELCKLEEGLDLIKEAIKSANSTERLIEKKSKNIETIGVKGSEMLEKDENQRAEAFFENIESVKKLCDEKIISFLRKKFKK